MSQIPPMSRAVVGLTFPSVSTRKLCFLSVLLSGRTYEYGLRQSVVQYQRHCLSFQRWTLPILNKSGQTENVASQLTWSPKAP